MTQPPEPHEPQPGSTGSSPYESQPPPGEPPYPPPQPGYNVPAILSLVFAFVFAPVGIVLGHVAKRQIRRTGEQGNGLATAGLILSYIFTGLAVLACCGAIVAAIAGGMAEVNTQVG
jgi:hypothetical protein